MLAQVATWTGSEVRLNCQTSVATRTNPTVPRLRAPTWTGRHCSTIPVSSSRYGPRLLLLRARSTARVVDTGADTPQKTVGGMNRATAELGKRQNRTFQTGSRKTWSGFGTGKLAPPRRRWTPR